MGQEYWKGFLSGRRRGLGAGLLRAGLAAASLPWSGVMRLRRRAYEAGLLASHSAGVPVICVGNITAGGTGKTPMIVWVLRRLTARGMHPGYLTRGWTRGHTAATGHFDEAEVVRRLCRAPAAVDRDRVRGARRLAGEGCDVVVLEDGFHHLRLRRDLNVVLIDATEPFGYGHVLPRGLLREPLGALRAADALVVTRSDQVGQADLAEIAWRPWRRGRRFTRPSTGPHGSWTKAARPIRWGS